MVAARCTSVLAMASDDERQAPATAEPVPCAPCRGTGRVISGLGGQQAGVSCPWCEGGGVQIAGHDAQAARRTSASD